MYEIMATITMVIAVAILVGEMAYHGHKLYNMWLNDEYMMKYVISYDPILKSTICRDGSDWVMCIFLRCIILLIGPIMVGLCWPVTLVAMIMIAVANYHKYLHRLKQECGGR